MTVDRFQSQGIQFLAFHPAMLSLYSDVINGARAVPHDVSEALRNSGAEAVLDGPMFERTDPSLPYSRQTSGTVEYRHYDLSGGIDIPTSHPSQGITISVMPDGSTRAGNGSAVPPGARVSVQLYPALVINGVAQHVTDNGPASRAALVVLRDGRMAFAAGPSMQLSDFAQALVDAGALYAGYTDGGGSTSLASTGFYTGSSEHRKVLTWLLAKSPQPGKTVGAGSTVVGSLAIAALVIAVGAIVWNAAKSRRSIARHNPSSKPSWMTSNSLSAGPFHYDYRWGGKDNIEFKVVRYGPDDESFREWNFGPIYGNERLPHVASEISHEHNDVDQSLPMLDFLAAEELYKRDYKRRFQP